jgi:hypothetical protein
MSTDDTPDLDLFTWLEQNARPSWKFVVILEPIFDRPRHLTSLEERVEKCTGKNVGRIRELIEEYERELPELGGWFGFPKPITEARYRVDVYVPRRNDGRIIFGAWWDNTDPTYYNNFSLKPIKKKDIVISWDDAVVKYTRKPREPKLTVIK